MSARLFLLGILLIAAVLRLWDLSSYPAGFTPDEASFGYDAYSILNSGKDQWGKSFPLSFRSFGDFKAPLYTYITIPSVAIFGLNEFSVRLPNAIFGILSVLAVFLLAKELLKSGENSSVTKYAPVVSAFLLAVSPWHISLSRGAFEANLTTFLLPIGIFAFLRGLKSGNWMIVAALIFGLNLFSYHSARLVTPLIVLFLLFLWRREVKIGTKLVIPAVVFLILIGAAILSMFFGGGTRAGDVSILNPTGGWGSVADRRYEAVQSGLPDALSRVFSNKPIYVFGELTKNYLSYISPTFLFTQGAGESTYGMIPGHGVVYLFELPFLLAAFWVMAKKRLNLGSGLILILVWLFIVPIPAALAKGPGYAANRAAIMMPAIQILSAYGVVIIFEQLKKRKVWLWTYGVFGILGVLVFLEAYFFHAPRTNGPSMSYGWREAAKYIRSVEANYDEIVVSRAFSEPHIFVAFQNKWDPSDYQKQAQDWLRYEKQGLLFVDQLGEWKLGKYTFRDIRYGDDQDLQNTLLVGRARDFPEKIEAAEIINYPNGKPAFVIVTNAKNN